MSQQRGSAKWFAWGFAWTALMVPILAVGHVEWPNSEFNSVVPVFGSILGNGLISYRRRHGYWPWTRRVPWERLTRND